MNNTPHPTDKYVGAQIRFHRVAQGLSQTEVATRLGISFQQVQKYEIGSNRVAASRLMEIAEILQVRPGDLFPSGTHPKSESRLTKEEIQLVTAFRKSMPVTREAIMSLVLAVESRKT
jgi:transcriptional regulator with XRE-family HTH domain